MTLRDLCPHHETRPYRCQCGAMVYSYTGYNTTAQRRVFNVADGLVHECPHRIALADIVECICGQAVCRLPDGAKTDMDGTPHVCRTRKTMRAAQPVDDRIAEPEPAPRPQAKKTPDPSTRWHGVISPEVHRVSQ